jgi:hypothetical protein
LGSTLEGEAEAIGGDVAIAAPESVVLMGEGEADAGTKAYGYEQEDQDDLDVVDLLLDVAHLVVDVSECKH